MSKLPHPPLDAWSNIDPAEAEARYARAERLLIKAEEAITAQIEIIEHDGERKSYRLALASLENAKVQHEQELADLRRFRRQENIYFALDGDNFDNHCAPLEVIGKSCIELQSLFDRVCQSRLTGKYAISIPHEVKRQARLIAHASYPSSFGLHLTVPTQSQTDGYSLILDGLEETFNLINRANPAELAARHGRFALGAFRRLVNVLIKAEARPKAQWKTLSGEQRSWAPSDASLNELHHRLEKLRISEPIKKREEGILAGASTLSNKFEFVGESGIVRGRVPRALIDQISSCFNKQCVIWYEETDVIDDSTEDVKRYITLIGAELIKPKTSST